MPSSCASCQIMPVWRGQPNSQSPFASGAGFRSKCARGKRYDGGSRRARQTARADPARRAAVRAWRSAVGASSSAREDWLPAPVEYAAAVERYLAQACLGPASRRVYRISLAAWAWPLVGQRAPRGERRRGAVPPVVPLALLDDPAACARLAAALAGRAACADARTVNRELSALRSAVGWWLDQRWIRTDATAGLRHLATPGTALPPLTPDQVAGLFLATRSLREHAFWRMLYDTAGPGCPTGGPRRSSPPPPSRSTRRAGAGRCTSSAWPGRAPPRPAHGDRSRPVPVQPKKSSASA